MTSHADIQRGLRRSFLKKHSLNLKMPPAACCGAAAAAPARIPASLGMGARSKGQFSPPKLLLAGLKVLGRRILYIVIYRVQPMYSRTPRRVKSVQHRVVRCALCNSDSSRRALRTASTQTVAVERSQETTEHAKMDITEITERSHKKD